MLPPTTGSHLNPDTTDNGRGREVEQTTTALRRNYHDAVRLAAREEILANLAEDIVTAQLHADTARFHHGAAHAYAKALDLLLGERLSVVEDKQKAKESDPGYRLGPDALPGSSIPGVSAGPAMTDASGGDSSKEEGATGGSPLVGNSETDDLIYRSLQAWSRPHPTEGVVTVHFATREHPERRFTLTAAAARDLAVQLMRHSKRVQREKQSKPGR